MVGDFYCYANGSDPYFPWTVAIENPEGGFTEYRYAYIRFIGNVMNTVTDYHVMAHKQRYKLLIENAELIVDNNGVAIIRPAGSREDPGPMSGAV